MPSISLRLFGGLRPAINERALPAQNATIAHNTELRDSTIESFKEPLAVDPFAHLGDEGTAGTKVNGIHRVNDNKDCCTGAVTFDCYSSVIEPPTPGDCPGFEGVVVFPCGCDCPDPYRYFPCEDKTYPLIVPRPVSTLRTRLVVPSTGIANEAYRGPDQRSYTYTWVDRFGVESPPANPTEPVYAHDDETWELSGFSDPPPNATCVRIYRTSSFFEGGDNPDATFATSFQLVEEVPLETNANGIPLNPGFYIDDRCLREMDHGTLHTELDCPPPCFDQVIMTESGYAVGFHGNIIRVSERYEPHNWPERYRVELPDRIVALAVMYDYVFIGTSGRPYRMNVAFTEHREMADATIDPVPFTENFPCLSKYAMVGTSFGAIYPTHKGLVALAPSGPARLLTKNRIDERDWVEWWPNIAVWHQGKYYASRSPLGKSFIFDVVEEAEGELDLGDVVTIDWNPDAAHAGRDGRLYFSKDGQLYTWNEGYRLMPYEWQSKKFTTPGHMQYAAIKVSAYYGPPVTVKIYADGRLFDTRVISSNIPRRLKFNGRGIQWQIKVEGTTQICEIHMATSIAELSEGELS